MNIDNARAIARASIKKHEGWRAHAYSDATGREIRDPAGDMTIGWGFNIEQNGLPTNVREFWLAALLDQATLTARNFARASFESLTDNQAAVVIELAYMLGEERLARFERFRAALEAGDATRAADELKNSRMYADHASRVDALRARLVDPAP